MKKYLFGSAMPLAFLLITSLPLSACSAQALYPVEEISHGHGLAVDVSDPNKLYIATHYGLFVLMNEKELYQVGSKKDDYMGFSPHPTNPKLIFASGHPSTGGNIGFQRSEDGGQTWKKVSDGINGPVDFHAMAISPANPNLIYGWYQGNLQKSTDQGKTWNIVNKDILAIQLAADPKDENKVYAATPDGSGILVSTDQGAHFSSLSDDLSGGAAAALAIDPTDSTIMLVFSEKIGGIAKSIDHGKTWKKINADFKGETLIYMAFNPNQTDIVYALSHENNLYKSGDSGNSWTKIR